MARMHELASVSPPYERVPNILRYTFNNLFIIYPLILILCLIMLLSTCILRGTRNLSFVLRRSLLRTFETIWVLVITLECSNITASKSIRRERK